MQLLIIWVSDPTCICDSFIYDGGVDDEHDENYMDDNDSDGDEYDDDDSDDSIVCDDSLDLLTCRVALSLWSSSGVGRKLMHKKLCWKRKKAKLCVFENNQ